MSKHHDKMPSGTKAPLWYRILRWSMTNGYLYCQLCFTCQNLTMDHIIPASKGGKAKIGNIAILCADCNVQKADNYINLEPIEYPPLPFIEMPVKDIEVGTKTIFGTVKDKQVHYQKDNKLVYMMCMDEDQVVTTRNSNGDHGDNKLFAVDGHSMLVFEETKWMSTSVNG